MTRRGPARHGAGRRGGGQRLRRLSPGGTAADPKVDGVVEPLPGSVALGRADLRGAPGADPGGASADGVRGDRRGEPLLHARGARPLPRQLLPGDGRAGRGAPAREDGGADASRRSSCRRCSASLPLERQGLLLVVGATGAGKSTTLAAMIDHRNAQSRGHVVTIEDPVEFIHASKQSVVSQREVGIDTESYLVGLQNAPPPGPGRHLRRRAPGRRHRGDRAALGRDRPPRRVSTLHATNATGGHRAPAELLPARGAELDPAAAVPHAAGDRRPAARPARRPGRGGWRPWRSC